MNIICKRKYKLITGTNTCDITRAFGYQFPTLSLPVLISFCCSIKCLANVPFYAKYNLLWCLFHGRMSLLETLEAITELIF